MSSSSASRGGCAVVFSALCLLLGLLTVATNAAPSPTPGAVPALLSPRDWVRSPAAPASNAANVPGTSEHLRLLRTALVACTDGSLHGVDRHTGIVRWSLGCGAPWPDTSSGAPGQQEECLPFRPVVSASYGPHRIPLTEMLAQANDSELSIYLAEPTEQGELYALTGSPSALSAQASAFSRPRTATSHNALPATLAKLPLTLPQLVSLSPFTFSDDDARVFVGSKQARLVEVNVRTGAIRSMYGDISVSNLSSPGDWNWSAHGSSNVRKDDSDDVWALIGRTDYTLAVHAKHDPSLTQTLYLSLYSPNLADRDILAAWRAQLYPDPRRVLVLPEEGSLVCLDTSVPIAEPAHVPDAAGPDERKTWVDSRSSRQTIWRTEMGASVASVFDFVQPSPSGQGRDVDEPAHASHRPVLVPHPALRPEDIFPMPNQKQGGMRREAKVIPNLGGNTYVGASEGSLYAMSSVRYPLAALGQPAPASRPSECRDLQCMVGSYQTERPAGLVASLPQSQWFDRPHGIDGPATDPWDTRRVSTIDPPTAAPPLPPSYHPTMPKTGQISVALIPVASRFISAALGLIVAALAVLVPLWRGRKASTHHKPANSDPNSSTHVWADACHKTVVSAATNQQNSLSEEATRRSRNLGTEAAQVAETNAPSKATPIPLPQVRSSRLVGERVASRACKALAASSGAASTTVAVLAPASPGAALPSAASIEIASLGAEQHSSSLNGLCTSVPAHQPESSPPVLRTKKKRRGKRAGQQVAAKAARAERIAAAEAEVQSRGPAMDVGYFSNSTPDASEGSASEAAAVRSDFGSVEVTDALVQNETGATTEFATELPARVITPALLGSTGSMTELSPSSFGSLACAPSGSPTNSCRPDLATIVPYHARQALDERDLTMANPQRDQEAHMVEQHLFTLEGKGQVLHLAAPAARGSSLVISDEVLGYGSSGTVVFKGSFQGRAVAVKRLLKDFTSIALKEVHLLESADDHPNVVRYFYQEVTDSFLYIALELCQATLADVLEQSSLGPYQDLLALLEPKSALQQIAQGLQHLHGLSIVHRDIKPHNILVTVAAPPPSARCCSTAARRPRLKMLLSDFGLSKKLDGLVQSSFSQTANHPAGTVGWRAPEILRGEVSLESGAESTDGSEELKPAIVLAERGEDRRRLTRAVDLFSFGCIAYYVLSRGQHPFGSRFVRELNVLRGEHDLGALASLGEEGHEGRHLILGCICPEPARRPTASEILLHPFFWTPHKRLQFLLQSSDAFDTLERDPPSLALLALEQRSADVLGLDGWIARVDPLFAANLGKFRSYDSKRVQDLLRAMRNKAHHYQDMSNQLKKLLGDLPDQFLLYFTTLFPKLLLHVYTVLSHQPSLRSEPRLRVFLEEAADV